MVPAELASDGQLAAQLQQIQQLQALPAQVAEQVRGVGQIIPAVSGLAGAVMWLMGRRLAAPLVAMIGLLLGTAAGGAAAFSAGAQGATGLIWLIGGGIVGMVLAWLLFRLGMAALLAALLAMAGPLLLLTLMHQTPLDVSALHWHWPQNETAPLQENLRAALTDLWSQVSAQLEDWWSRLGYGQVSAMAVLAIMGGVVGLIGGLIWPYGAAGVVTACIGGLLILSAAFALAPSVAPAAAQWLPRDPWQIAGMLGLITLAGAMLQWIIWRRPADK